MSLAAVPSLTLINFLSYANEINAVNLKLVPEPITHYSSLKGTLWTP